MECQNMTKRVLVAAASMESWGVAAVKLFPTDGAKGVSAQTALVRTRISGRNLSISVHGRLSSSKQESAIRCNAKVYSLMPTRGGVCNGSPKAKEHGKGMYRCLQFAAKSSSSRPAGLQRLFAENNLPTLLLLVLRLVGVRIGQDALCF